VVVTDPEVYVTLPRASFAVGVLKTTVPVGALIDRGVLKGTTVDVVVLFVVIVVVAEVSKIIVVVPDTVGYSVADAVSPIVTFLLTLMEKFVIAIDVPAEIVALNVRSPLIIQASPRI
jgi:isopropylmalate/homocitrate/citramalate synthase